MESVSPTALRALSVGLLMLALVAIVQAFRGEIPMDFLPYWQAANDLHLGADPYARRNELPWTYPPTSLLLVWPLGLMPVHLAAAMFSLLSLMGLTYVASFWSRETGLQWPTALTVGACILLFPVFRALEPMNVEVILLAVLTLSLHVTGKSRWLVAFLAGFILAMKPPWVLAGVVMLSSRGVSRGVFLGFGGSIAMGLSMLHATYWEGFVASAQHVLSTQVTISAWNVSPWLGIMVLVIWGLGAVWVGRRDPRWLIYYGATSVAFGPRPAIYAYVLLIPVLLKLVSFRPRLAAVVWGIFSVPIGLLAILEWSDAGIVLGIGYSMRTMILGLVYQVVVMACAVGILWNLYARLSRS